MNAQEFYDLVSSYFGPRVTQEGYAEATRVYTGTLYETFRVRCGLDGDHGEFGAGIECADASLTTFLNRRLSLNSDAESILASLQVVDEWCRLHLPDKFLERYEAALGITTS
jgi:hypothetical protein